MCQRRLMRAPLWACALVPLVFFPVAAAGAGPAAAPASPPPSEAVPPPAAVPTEPAVVATARCATDPVGVTKVTWPGCSDIPEPGPTSLPAVTRTVYAPAVSVVNEQDGWAESGTVVHVFGFNTAMAALFAGRPAVIAAVWAQAY